LKQEGWCSLVFGADVGGVGDGEITGGAVRRAGAADCNQLVPSADRASKGTAATMAHGRKANGACAGGGQRGCVAQSDVTAGGVPLGVGSAQQVAIHFGEEAPAAACADGEDRTGSFTTRRDEAAGVLDVQIAAAGVHSEIRGVGPKGG